ncbi:hypothetical protein ACLOJK_010435 [Asimina triloba]
MEEETLSLHNSQGERESDGNDAGDGDLAEPEWRRKPSLFATARESGRILSGETRAGLGREGAARISMRQCIEFPDSRLRNVLHPDYLNFFGRDDICGNV